MVTVSVALVILAKAMVWMRWSAGRSYSRGGDESNCSSGGVAANIIGVIRKLTIKDGLWHIGMSTMARIHLHSDSSSLKRYLKIIKLLVL